MQDHKFEPYISTQHVKVGAVSRVTFDPCMEQDYTLFSTSHKKERNYERADIYLFMDYMHTREIGYDSLMRALMYELSQVYSGERLVDLVQKRAYDFEASKSNELSIDSPAYSLELSLESSEDKQGVSNYFSLLRELAQKNTSSVFEGVKKEIVSFLSKFREYEKVSFFKKEDSTIITDDGRGGLSSLSTLVAALSESKEGEIVFVEKLFGKEDSSEALVPSASRTINPLSDTERDIILGKLEGKIVVRVGRVS